MATLEQTRRKRKVQGDEYLRRVREGSYTPEQQAAAERELRDLRADEVRLTDPDGEGGAYGQAVGINRIDASTGSRTDREPDPVLDREREKTKRDAERAERKRRRNFFAEAKALYPDVPEAVVRVYAGHFAAKGDAALAWALTRQSPEWKQTFGAVLRADGSLRMTEGEYLSTKQEYRKHLRGHGINPDFMDQYLDDLVRNDKSAREFGAQLDVVRQRVVDNIEDVRAQYGNLYGIESKTVEEFMVAAIRPELGEAILQGRITRAQIAAEAKVRGFQRSMSQLDRLARQGVTQETARGFYGQVQERLPVLSAIAARFNEGAVTVDDVEAAGLLGDPIQKQRLDRAAAQEQSSFSGQSGVRRDREGGLTGLQRR